MSKAVKLNATQEHAFEIAKKQNGIAYVGYNPRVSTGRRVQLRKSTLQALIDRKLAVPFITPDGGFAIRLTSKEN